MKKVMLIAVFVAVASLSLQAALTIYTDRTQWENNVGLFQTENFADAVLTPGVSVVTDAGFVLNGMWNDRVVAGGDKTTWNFTFPVVGWGGNFDLSVAGAGQGLAMTLELYAGGNLVVSSQIPNTYTGQFWGLVSTDAFDAVRVTAGTQPGSAETYFMDNMVFAPVPEPSSFLAGALLLLPFGISTMHILRRRQAA